MNRFRLARYLLASILGGSVSLSNAASVEVTSFQLKVSEGADYCLALKPDEGENRSGSIGLVAKSCTDSLTLFWTPGDNKTLVGSLSNPVDDQESWCLTRSRNIKGVESLSIRPCYRSFNEAQSWTYNDQGILYRYKKDKGPDGWLRVFSAETKEDLGLWQGSFQWARNNPPNADWCYTLPWKETCNKVCEPPIEQPGCDDGSGSSGSSYPEWPTPDAPVAHKKAAWFVLKQSRPDDNVCLDIMKTEVPGPENEKVTVLVVGTQYCEPGKVSQQWAHDIATKQVFNRNAEGEKVPLCLTLTKSDVRMSPCLNGNQVNHSQMWYFTRSLKYGTPYAALFSFTNGRDSWKSLLLNPIKTLLEYRILPKYNEDCERVEGKCYDLTDGELRNEVPFYTN